jgi:hypothetical protein
MTPRPQNLFTILLLLVVAGCASVRGERDLDLADSASRSQPAPQTIRPLPPDEVEQDREERFINSLLPTARAQHVDLRTRWFELGDGRSRNRIELEGSVMLGEDWRFTPRVRGVRTDAAGDRTRTSFEQFRFRAVRLIDIDDAEGVSLGVGGDWFKDLGDAQGGTGAGNDRIAPMIGIRWQMGEDDAITFMGRYFYSYRDDRGVDQTRESQGRVLWVHQIPDANAWFRADYRMNFDHEDGNDKATTVELQIGKLVTDHVGIYIEAFLGDSLLDTNSYDHGLGVGMRWVF